MPYLANATYVLFGLINQHLCDQPKSNYSEPRRHPAGLPLAWRDTGCPHSTVQFIADKFMSKGRTMLFLTITEK